VLVSQIKQMDEMKNEMIAVLEVSGCCAACLN